MQNEELNINRLIIKCLEGEISPEEIEQLNQALAISPEACKIYAETVFINSQISKPNNIGTYLFGTENAFISSGFDEQLWRELAEDEKSAPAVKIVQEPPVQEFAENIDVKMKPKVNKVNLLTIIISTAALLLLLVHASLLQDHVTVDVATLSDSMQAKWADGSITLKKKDRLFTNQVFSLSEGLVEIETDSGVRLTVEGPAEFQVLPNADLYLNHGRVYASVSESGIGFTVAMANTKVIDLGTEFGVDVQDSGTMELHVFKGKTTLVSGGSWLGKTAYTIAQNQARRVSDNGVTLEEIPINKEVFARVIQSETNQVWRGGPIDLADIVGNGNGLGTGQLQADINPLTGQFEGEGINYGKDRLGNGQYTPVLDNPYIDGVFVPNGDAQPVIVSSEGHIFAECPSTNNTFFMDIMNSQIRNPRVPALWEKVPNGTGIYGTDISPSILMHANTGITFDLEAIRRDYPGSDLMRFTATAGLSLIMVREGNVSVWVLVDGKVRYSQANISEKGREYPVEVMLQKTDRFLTLISTDGGDIDHPNIGDRATDSDWGIFVQPKLVFSGSSAD